MDPLYVDYHDREWGVPSYDDRRLFEMLCLEGAQAGLSWITILRKRDHYRRAFDRFDPARMARYGARERSRLLGDAGIVRNRAKIDAFIANARAYLEVIEQRAFCDYVWQFTDGRVIKRRPRVPSEIRTWTAHSLSMSKDMKSRGFAFVGPTVCYAYMQAIGMVDEHLRRCWRVSR